MLLDKSKNYIEKIELLQHQEEIREINRRAAVRYDEVHKVFDRISDLEKWIHTAQQSLEYQVSEEQIKNLTLAIKEIQNLAVLTKQRLADEDLTDLKKREKAIFKQAERDWDTYYRNNVSRFVNLLKTVPTRNPQVGKQLRERLNSLESFEITIDPAMVSSLLEQAQQTISELKVTEQVISFLIKVNIGRATIVDLTPEIMEWIHDIHYEDKFKIRL